MKTHHVNATTAEAAARLLDAYADRGPSSERPLLLNLAAALMRGDTVVVNSAEVS